MGLTGSLLVDAALNSIHAPTYLLVAALVMGGSALMQARETAADPDAARRLRLALGALSGVGLLTIAHVLQTRPISWKPDRSQEGLLAIARRDPGKVYLPWNALITIISERKIYPFDEALRYLWMAKLEPPRAANPSGGTAGSLHHLPGTEPDPLCPELLWQGPARSGGGPVTAVIGYSARTKLRRRQGR